MINWITLIPFLGFISYLLILIFQFENWLKSRQGRIFAIYLALSAFYSLTSWLMHIGAPPSPSFWFYLELMAVFFFIPIVPHIAIEFPVYKERLKIILFPLYFSVIILEILLLTGKLVKNVQIISNTGIINIEFYPLINLVWILTVLSLIFSIGVYIFSYLTIEYKIYKHLLIFPLLGTVITFISGLLNAFPTLRGYPVDLIGNFLFSLFVSYAILRYQFLTPVAIFRKSSVYLIIVLTFIVFALLLISFIQPVSQLMPPWLIWLWLLPLGLLFTLVYAPLRKKIQDWLDRAFFGEQYIYRLAIEDFGRKASSSLNFKELTSSLVKTLHDLLNCPVALFLREREEESLKLVEQAGLVKNESAASLISKNNAAVEWLVKAKKPAFSYAIAALSGPAGIMKKDLKWLDTMQAELVAPLVFKGQLSGVLVLGKKMGMYPYNDEDISLLTTLSNQVAVALENARLYFESQEAYRELKNMQEHLIHSERVRILGEVSGGMAHDLNNLLAVISARTEISLELINNDEARRNLELALKASQDGSEVLKRLQSFARKPAVELSEKIDINHIIQDILPMAEHRRLEIEQKSVFLEINTQLGALKQVQANSSEIRQAIINILFNAFDAIQLGGKVDIETRQEGKWVILSIRDDGIGMTPEVKERIFEPFFTTKGERGSGLGLSVALGIVDKHQGKITVDSEPGKGSTFHIFLPSIEEPGGEEVVEKKEKVIAGSRGSILIIKDDSNLGEVMSHFLNQAGYEAVLVNNGPDGLAHFQKNNFKLVITDWGLGSMTGGDIAQCIKDMDSGVPIIVITGWQPDLPVPALKRLGVVEIISKPFTREVFLKAIARALTSS